MMTITENFTANDKTYIVDELKKYMFDETRLDFFSQNKLKYNISKPTIITKHTEINNNNTNNINNTNSYNKKQINSFFIPNSATDTLFWCFYIMKNGFHLYEMFPHKNLIGEKKIKIDYVELIRNNKLLLKKYKFSTFANIENVLANEKRLDISTFFSLCVLENMNVLFIKNKMYYELLMNDSDDIFIIRQTNNNIFGYESRKISETLKLKEELLKIDNVDKPLKAISAYKLDDLLFMCNKLELNTIDNLTKKSKKKKDLYETLFQYF